jgi:glycosyltransferase involved in cell wall biosynthesis
MDWYPNEDALIDFAAHVWPRLRARHPDISMTVVGRNPTARLRAAAADAGIDVTGTVDDVRPFIDEAQVYVVPLRVGGGTRPEDLRSARDGEARRLDHDWRRRPWPRPDRHFIAADGHDALARSILDLLDDAPRRAALGAEGRRLVDECYSWGQVARDFERSVEHAARRHDLDLECADRRLAVS